MALPTVKISLPDWLGPFLAQTDPVIPRIENRMSLVIGLSQLNVEHQTGGPFAAAVFGLDTGKLISVGLNRVIPANCSIGHAEMIALALAQQGLGTYDLSEPSIGPCQLVTSTEPCAMCLGAIPWSGIADLVCAARDEDARAIGFDEGHKPPNWAAHLRGQGLTITLDLLRPQAVEVLQHYHETQGPLYNPTRQ